MIYLNDILITPTIFPDGTSQVWKIDETPFNAGNNDFTILWVFENEAELFHICQLVPLIRSIWKNKCIEDQCFENIYSTIKLHMPYLPYGRQDKAISNTSTFAFHTFSNIINALFLDEVSTIDAHNGVAFSLIHKAKNFSPVSGIRHAIAQIRMDLHSVGRGNILKIAYPDLGAARRYLIFPAKIIGHKVRDQETGYITQYDIEGDPKGKDILIVDDLCDGGMTFILMAKELYKQGAKSVHLYVSHGIFSKGIQVLKDAGIKSIFDYEGERYLPYGPTRGDEKSNNSSRKVNNFLPSPMLGAPHKNTDKVFKQVTAEDGVGTPCLQGDFGVADTKTHPGRYYPLEGEEV